MFSTILSWLGSLIGGPFATAAVDAYKAKLEAGNNAEKIAADLAAQKAAIDEQRDALAAQIVIAEQGRWYTALMRPAFAYPVAIYFGKIFLWDKALGLGMTDPLSPDLSQIAGIVIAGLFGSMAVETAARVFSARR